MYQHTKMSVSAVDKQENPMLYIYIYIIYIYICLCINFSLLEMLFV